MYFLPIALVILFPVTSNGARILAVAPTPAFSHQLIMKTIYEELSLRGHTVIAFTTDPLNNKSLTNLTEIDMSYIYKKYLSNANFENLFVYYKLLIVRHIQEVLAQISEEFLAHPEMKKLTNHPHNKFDLVLVEWSVNPSLAVLAKVFDCVMVGVRSLDLRLEGHDSIGNPTNPSYIPVGYMDHRSDFFGRLDNTVFNVLWRFQHHLFLVPEAQRIVKRHFPTIIESVLELEKKVSLVLMNTNPLLTAPRPLVPAVVEIGGIHLGRKLQRLPKDMKTFLDGAAQGVVYFNLGSNVNSRRLNEKYINTIVRSFAEIPYKVMWKFEKDADFELPPNVKTWKWLPQEAVLAHPNVKVFVTHGGLHSFEEAVYYKVPLIGIPFFADNHVNVQRMAKLEIGRRLDILSLSKKELVETITDIAQNKTYRANIRKVSNIFRDQQIKPLDKAVWWIEYILRHNGAPHLRTSAVHMNWFTYLSLDVFIFFFSIGFLLILFLFLLFYFLFRHCSYKNVHKLKNG